MRAIVSGFTFALETDREHPASNPALGGGSLWDVGSYPVTYAQLIAGHEPKMVFGIAHWHASGVDEEFMGMLRFDGGMTANIYAGLPHAVSHVARSAGHRRRVDRAEPVPAGSS